MFNFFKDKIIFISDYDHTIGNLSEKLFYVIHKAKREDKKVLFIRKRLLFDPIFRMVGYKQLRGIYDLQSPYIYKSRFLEVVIGSYYGFVFSLQFYFYALLKVLKITDNFEYRLIGKNCNNIINLRDLKYFAKESVDNIDWSDIYEEKLEFSFPSKQENIFIQYLSKLGIKESDWYVCLHIRTSFYHKDKDIEYANIRNSTPDNYRKTIKYINSIGGKVIRLGDPVEMSIDDISIDYPNSKYKSELMDLFLIKNCKFYIGTNSGILDSAFLLGAKVLGVNYSDFCLCKGFKSCDKFLYKHVYFKDTKSKIVLKNIFQQPINININMDSSYTNMFHKNYILKENNDDEVLQATKIMIKSISNNNIESNYEFDRVVKDAINRWVEDKNLNIEEKYRYYIRSFSNGNCFDFQLNEK